jgi:pectate lyase
MCLRSRLTVCSIRSILEAFPENANARRNDYPMKSTERIMIITPTVFARTARITMFGTSLLALGLVAPCKAQRRAFPEAQGGGAASAGGRGGVVKEVTNLDDSGTGSLRACVNASGPRTCVFRVAGLISQHADLMVNNPFLTIAGQTAPGQIILGGPGNKGYTLRVSTHDVIIRYLTISPDDFETQSGPSTGTVGLGIINGDNYNIIIDHVSTRWAGNKMWVTGSNYVGPNRLITTSWSLFYEPHAGHPVGPGTAGNPIGCPDAAPNPTLENPCFSSLETDIDFHHNMFVNISHRIPETGNKSLRWVNNLTFNWAFYAFASLGAVTLDVIGNKWVRGNLNSSAQAHEIHVTEKSPQIVGNPSLFASGNIGPNQPDPNGDQYRMVSHITGENGRENGAIPDSWKRHAPMPATDFPIIPDPVASLDNLLLPTVGNSRHLSCNGTWVQHRDDADTRIIAQYKSIGAGGFWPNGITATGTAALPLPTPAAQWQDRPVVNGTACTESLHDGIPDEWKKLQGLSRTNRELFKSVASDGYTILEHYLNGVSLNSIQDKNGNRP